jgi:glycerophosphoryl diester phosphodiesterase
MPAIIAHRGGALLWPENSLRACRGAIALGVDQVQLDVRLSADGQVIVMHDPTLDRTAEGSGPVHLRSWAELSTMRLRGAPGETIPSLEMIADVMGHGDVWLRLELKAVPGDAAGPDLPERVVDILRRAGIFDRTVMTSFAPTDLQRVRALAPTMPLAWLLDAAATSAWADASAEWARHLGCTTIGVRHDRLTPALRQSCVRSGLRLCCFGANEAAALVASLAANPEEISTDRPDLALRFRATVAPGPPGIAGGGRMPCEPGSAPPERG